MPQNRMKNMNMVFLIGNNNMETSMYMYKATLKKLFEEIPLYHLMTSQPTISTPQHTVPGSL